MAFDLENILFAWRESYGGRIPKDVGARKQAFLQLFADLEANGLTKEQVLTTVKQHTKLIVGFCVNPNWKTKELRIWKTLVEDGLKAALSLYNPPKRGVVNEEVAQRMQEGQNREAELKSEEIKKKLEEPELEIGKNLLDTSLFKDVPAPPKIEEDALLKELEGEPNE